MARANKEQYVSGALPLLANTLSIYGDSLVEGVTFRQFYLLSMIGRMGRADKSLARIAEFCGTTRQNIRRMLETLADKGYIELAASPLDGRALTVSLTRRAKNLLARNENRAETGLSLLFSDFSDAELDALVAGLSRLGAALDENLE